MLAPPGGTHKTQAQQISQHTDTVSCLTEVTRARNPQNIDEYRLHSTFFCLFSNQATKLIDCTAKQIDGLPLPLLTCDHTHTPIQSLKEVTMLSIAG